MNTVSRLLPALDAAAVPQTALRDLRTESLAAIIREHAERPVRRLLVVGCGSGKEAAVLSAALHAETTGVDIVEDFDPGAAARVTLRRGDATRLQFADGSFDCIYSFHALEHIPDYRKALQEMRRVLIPGGSFCIGTPNRLRLVAYFGSPGVSLRTKLRWNLNDWKQRLRGRFRNEYGAHAGYSSAELAGELRRAFGHAEEISLDYYQRVYRNHTGTCRFLSASGLGRFLYPCVYFVGRNESSAGIAT
jgi:SAM-dependent methyltransferase